MPTDPNAVAQKWRQNLAASVPSIKASINALQVNPMQKAAQNGAAYAQGVMDAYNSGRWASGLMRVDFQEWKQKTAEVGTQRIASGAQAAMPKMTAFLGQLLPYTESVKAQIKQMPNSTQEERKQRMIANFEKMSQFKFTGRG
jgi:hypothetical protein